MFEEVQTVKELYEKVVEENERPEMPEICPKNLRKLITRCWDKNPTSRPSFIEILKPPSFDEIVLEGLFFIYFFFF